MPKVRRQTDAYFCDYCGSTAPLFRECLRCKKTSCTDCKTEMVRYPARVGTTDPDDGWYCKACDPLIRDEKDELYQAYEAVGEAAVDRQAALDRIAKKVHRVEREVVRVRMERGL